MKPSQYLLIIAIVIILVIGVYMVAAKNSMITSQNVTDTPLPTVIPITNGITVAPTDTPADTPTPIKIQVQVTTPSPQPTTSTTTPLPTPTY